MLCKEKKHYYIDGHNCSDVLPHRKKWLEEQDGLELRQYLWVQLPLAKALELGEQGEVGDNFRALLENNKVTATCNDASPTAICNNGTADGGVSKVALQESLRNDMVFHYFGNRRGEEVSKEDDTAQP